MPSPPNHDAALWGLINVYRGIICISKLFSFMHVLYSQIFCMLFYGYYYFYGACAELGAFVRVICRRVRRLNVCDVYEGNISGLTAGSGGSVGRNFVGS